MVYYVHNGHTSKGVSNSPACDRVNFHINIFGFERFYYFYFGTYLEENLVWMYTFVCEKIPGERWIYSDNLVTKCIIFYSWHMSKRIFYFFKRYRISDFVCFQWPCKKIYFVWLIWSVISDFCYIKKNG